MPSMTSVEVIYADEPKKQVN